MSATIISISAAREKAAKKKINRELDFQTLFNNTSEFRNSEPEEKYGDISILNWAGLRESFQKEIAEDVFSKKMFERSVLISISFVSALLTSYARGEITNLGITEYLHEYEKKGDPKYLLMAANSAFIFFALMQQNRRRSAVKYQTMGLQFGPSLYKNYGNVKKSDFGHQMSEAFQPLGEIVRERFRIK